MKKHLFLCIAVAITAGLICFSSACKKTTAPVTCVSAMSDTVVTGQAVTFTSCTQGASSYAWSFGDGTTSTLASPVHTYTTPGTYSVTFIPSNSAGPGTTETITIVVGTPGGAWLFKSTTTNADSCGGAVNSGYGILVASGNSANNGVACFFLNALPAASGRYTVVSSLPTATNQVFIEVGTNGQSPNPVTYISTGGNGTQTVNVTVAGGKVSVVGSGIEVLNATNASDSAAVNFSIHQTK